MRHQVRPVTYDLFRFLATNDTIFQLAIALRTVRVANCELWTKAERAMARKRTDRQAAAPVTAPFRRLYIITSLSLSLTFSIAFRAHDHLMAPSSVCCARFLWPHFARTAHETACKCALIKICYVVLSSASLPPSYRNLCRSVESQFGFYIRCALKVSENSL